MSCLSTGQNSLILSNKYCWHSLESPLGTTTGGSDGFHVAFFSKLIFRSLSEPTDLMNTVPGELDANLKWCIWDIPFRAVLWHVLRNVHSKWTNELYEYWTIQWTDWLRNIHKRRQAYTVCYVVKITDFSGSKMLLHQSEAPVGCKFCVPDW